jgi:hypothetical protein
MVRWLPLHSASKSIRRTFVDTEITISRNDTDWWKRSRRSGVSRDSSKEKTGKTTSPSPLVVSRSPQN